jgi:P pilus assembly chaperone PapD
MTITAYEYGFIGKLLKKGLMTLAKVVPVAMAIAAAPDPVRANDLLVAPTRLEFDSRKRTAEVILSNIGSKTSTYRISLVVRRMTAEGKLEEVELPSETDQRTLDMISFAPRRVVLEPNQPQSIRVAVRRPVELARGEYRVHMLFRGIPDATPAVAAVDTPTEGFAIQLIPIYGVTIPVIVREGDLKATTTMSAPRLAKEDGRDVFQLDLARQGDRSTYGEIRVIKQGVDEPIVRAKGISVYTEIGSRLVSLPLDPTQVAAIRGPVTVQYFELVGDDARLVSELKATL